MAYCIQVAIENLRSVAFGSISGSYVAFGTPFVHSVRTICITNNTDGDMFISDDGVNDKLFIAAGSYKLYDLNTNRDGGPQEEYKFAINTQIYIKESTAPSKNSVYLEAFYAKGE